MTSLDSFKVIPVLSEDNSERATFIVGALRDAGVGCVEVTLRSDNALDVLSHLCKAFPDLVIGAGSVREPGDFTKIINAGAEFAVSPGTTRLLLEEANRWEIPYLPAAATVSELLVLRDAGYRRAKIFPAGALGGAGFLKSIAAPLPDMQFVPSGGVNALNAAEYLALECVSAISGSWMFDANCIKQGNWDGLQRSIHSAMQVFD